MSSPRMNRWGLAEGADGRAAGKNSKKGPAHRKDRNLGLGTARGGWADHSRNGVSRTERPRLGTTISEVARFGHAEMMMRAWEFGQPTANAGKLRRDLPVGVSGGIVILMALSAGCGNIDASHVCVRPPSFKGSASSRTGSHRGEVQPAALIGTGAVVVRPLALTYLLVMNWLSKSGSGTPVDGGIVVTSGVEQPAGSARSRAARTPRKNWKEGAT